MFELGTIRPTRKGSLAIFRLTPFGCLDERLLEDAEAFLQVLVRDDERNEDANDVAVEAAREEDEAALARELGRPLREVGGRLFRLPVDHELEGEHRPEPAHLAHVLGALGDLVEAAEGS